MKRWPRGSGIEADVQRYANRQGNSGVDAFEVVADGIRVRFRSGDIYTYTAASAGKMVVTRMAQLAREGKGLSTYISQHNPRFARKK